MTAAPINHGDFPGAGAGEVDFLQVTEDSFTDPTPLYDAPIHLPNKLLFFPLSFTSVASNGASDTTTGTLTMTIRADAGYFLGTIALWETGDYTLTGLGTSGTSADIEGMLSAQDISPGLNGTISDGVTYAPSPVFELPPPMFDEFTGEAVIDLTGLGITEVMLTLENTLETTSESGPGTTAFIQKKTIGIEASTVLIPEPATLGLLGLAGALGVRRRRR
ncbi:MAG: PEP-CTERM sorting domain-containing protein [bacterium]|nr:PEP-CTERM sorting domain-containing protein [bacterium]